MPITALYAGLLAPLFVLISARVIQARGRTGVTVGAGDDPDLLRRMRVQANFAEYVPFALLLIALAESLGTVAAWLHGLGVALLLARVMHAVGMSRRNEVLGLRVAGIATTFAVIIAAAIACLYGAVRHSA